MEVREFCDGKYTVLAEMPASCVVDYSVYEGSGYTASLDPLFVGSIKWDGCSNWDFPHGHYPLHFCSKESAISFGKFLGELYDWASELMPESSEYLGLDKYKG